MVSGIDFDCGRIVYMKQSKTTYVVGNWKMNPSSLAEAKKLFVSIRQKLRTVKEVTTVIAPPSVYLSDLARLSPSGRVGISAQRIWPTATGAQTGEISAPMVRSAGATYVIIGHSERRAQGINDSDVHARIQAALQTKLTPIVCIGEEARDDDGEFFSKLENQLSVSLQNLKKAEMARTIIAYEPVWAIGSGVTPSGADIYEMRLFIEKCLTKLFDRATARKVAILYGGSVTEQNAALLHKEGGMRGFLVGGASLDAKSFVSICKSAQTIEPKA